MNRDVTVRCCVNSSSMAEGKYYERGPTTFGSDGLIVTENDVSAAFFDLKTGLAGELFQKFENYGLCLALVVPNPQRHGERFNELAREHRSHARIRIVRSEDGALAWFCRGG